VIEVNGHDLEAIVCAFEAAFEVADKPSIMIAHTKKGKGVPFMERVPQWHGSVKLTRESRPRTLRRSAQHERASRVARCPQLTPFDRFRRGDSLREAFGRALTSLAPQYPQLVVLDADIAGGTGVHHFRKGIPSASCSSASPSRNMMAAAGGLAAVGMLPWSHIRRVLPARDQQARLSIAYAKRNVKIVRAIRVSMSDPTAARRRRSRIAAFRAIPGMTVISPADPIEMALATRRSRFRRPVYHAHGRSPCTRLFHDGHRFEIGKGQILCYGSDVTIVAAASRSRALSAAEVSGGRHRGPRRQHADDQPIDAPLRSLVRKETAHSSPRKTTTSMAGSRRRNRGEVAPADRVCRPCRPLQRSGEPGAAEHCGIGGDPIADAARPRDRRKQHAKRRARHERVPSLQRQRGRHRRKPRHRRAIAAPPGGRGRANVALTYRERADEAEQIVREIAAGPPRPQRCKWT
jgi:transketolase